jgi:hypothetical protein
MNVHVLGNLQGAGLFQVFRTPEANRTQTSVNVPLTQASNSIYPVHIIIALIITVLQSTLPHSLPVAVRFSPQHEQE